MADFLDEYIRVAGGGFSVVTDILNQANGQQRSIEQLLKLLVSGDRFANLSIPRYEINTKIEASILNAGSRDMGIHLDRSFRDSNNTDFLMESMERGIGSDIKRIEDEVYSLEKMLDLFAFFLADGKRFDGFFLETFSDNVTQNADLNIKFSDRDNLPLTADHFVHVDPDAGVAIRGNANPEKYIPITLAEAQINHFPIAKYELDIGPSSRGVMARIKSNSVIGNKAMPDFISLGNSGEFEDPVTTLRETDKGLVMRINYNTPSPVFAQLVKVFPLSNNAVELNQIFLYEAESNSGKIPLLDRPRKLTTPQTISFEGRILTSIEIVLRQPEYKREAFAAPVTDPTLSFDFNEVGRRVIRNYRDGIINLDHPVFRKPESWSKDFTFSRNAENNDIFLTRMLYGHNGNRGSLRPNVSKEVVEVLKRVKGGNKELFRHKTSGKYSHMSNLKNRHGNLDVRDTIKHRIKGIKGFDGGDSRYRTRATPYNIKNEAQIAETFTVDSEVAEGSFKYIYEIGVAGIELGTGAMQSKAVYVSQPIAMNGDPGIVRVSAIDSRSISLDRNRDSKYLNSIEYSVSNSSYPSSEQDWHAILPGQERIVEGERVFFNSAGTGYFRFRASVDEKVNIYVNGKNLEEDLDNYLFRTSDNSAYAGISLPRDHFSSDSFITVDYIPIRGYNEVDFSSNAEFEKVPLTYSSSREGRGEYIEAVAGRREYQLLNEPYIEKALVRGAEYDLSSGLSFKPVTIVFDNGEGAINLTNYQRGIQSKLDFSVSEYQFLQSGPVITFNKIPESNFKVIYQYIPSRLRVRAILRCNTSQFCSSSIDLIQVKAKTRHSDIRKI